MSTLGDFSTSRRVTRGSSRAASSRAGSEEAPSIAGDSSATPARSSQRLRNRASPIKEAVQTGRDVGNRGSTAYGAKGKSLNPTNLSLEDAQRAPEDLLQSAVQGAEANRPRGGGRAGSLPPIREDTVLNASSAVVHGSRHGSQSRAGSPFQDPTHDPDIGPEITQPAAERGSEAIAGHTSIVEDSSLVDRSLLQRIRQRVSGWHSRGIVAAQRQAANTGQAAANPNSDGVRGFANDWNNSEDEVEFPAPQLIAPRSVVWLSRLGVIFLLIVLVSLLDLYRGPLLGPRFDILSGRSEILSTNSGVVHGTHMESRLCTLENFVDKLTSRTRLGETITPDYQQINWFATANQATIVPSLTSPGRIEECQTREVRLPFERSKPWRYLYSRTRICVDDAAAVALKPWSEVDERFCAPPNRGKLQLTVKTSRVIAPTELVIEHPKDALIHKGETPKQVELFMDLSDASIDQINRIRHFVSNDVWKDSSPQQHRELDTNNALPESFARVGLWHYDLYAPKYIQSFRIPSNLKAHGIKSDHFAVRVNSNWGDLTSTCLYRVRLYGHDMSGIEEQLDNPFYN